MEKDMQQNLGQNMPHMILIYIDIDFPYLDSNLVSMLTVLIETNADLIIGYRNRQYYEHIPLVRKKISLWYKEILKRFLHLPIPKQD